MRNRYPIMSIPPAFLWTPALLPRDPSLPYSLDSLDLPLIFSMSSTRERRKRQRTEEALDGPCRPPKRQKSSIKLHSAEFYDSLSKIWLTRRALRELDRRTSQVNNSPQQPAPAPQLEYRGEPAKEIQRFARHGGPELSDLRGYLPLDLLPAMSSRHASRSSAGRHTKSTVPSTVPTSTSSKTRRSSAYDNDFEQHLIDHKIYPKGYDYGDGRLTPEPELEGFRERLAQPRPSLSPSRFTTSNFRAFERANDRVISEGKVMSTVIPIISGNVDIPNEENLQFTRLDPIANNTTVDAKPDFYDGARLADIDARVQEDLGEYIIPTGHATAPVAPNFFLEAKPPKGGADVAKRQACYDGALGARAMHKLQSYGQDEPVYDGNAYTISSTYHAGTGTLQMYATHPTQGEEGTEYHMTQVRSLALTDTADSFRHGATVFRNARDWAQEQRDAFISGANERARSTNAAQYPSESSDHNYVSDPTDVETASYPTQWEDPVDDSQYEPDPLVSNGIAGYTYAESSTFNLSNYNSYPADMCHIQESETSADELALDAYTITSTPTRAPSKRRHRSSGRNASKAPRHSGRSRK